MLRQPHPPVQALVVKYGRQAVLEELEEMCYEDMADVAMAAAAAIEEGRIARLAAEIVLNGTYPEHAQSQAREILGRRQTRP
jgi:hypothetical protein